MAHARDYFTNVVLNYGGDDCLIWPYAKYGNGYAHIADKNGHHLVHRLACIAVHGEPPTPTHEARHTCGKGSDGCCNPMHTEWGTRLENEADKLRHGTHLRGERSGTAKLTEEQVLEILSLRGKVMQKHLAQRYGVRREAISKIQTGKRWFHVGDSERVHEKHKKGRPSKIRGTV